MTDKKMKENMQENAQTPQPSRLSSSSSSKGSHLGPVPSPPVSVFLGKLALCPLPHLSLALLSSPAWLGKMGGGLPFR
jgi:hypothetical protein